MVRIVAPRVAPGRVTCTESSPAPVQYTSCMSSSRAALCQTGEAHPDPRLRAIRRSAFSPFRSRAAMPEPNPIRSPARNGERGGRRC